ncbi:fructosamine kinase family protein [Halobacillus sp. BBL2006]|uniref:fructosamine kinase family protein n=1 Tax=Halobacillus sp. BBL2006 TaxID=1543706 RepID=UPI0005423D4A|nr:fructosamine kinase family protein [Halobacillus sp. BBL2006]KHE72541.1 fructosamine kinase [Halobacillus sp. BBL2006]
MKDLIQSTLHKLEDYTAIEEIKQVSGGDINRSFLVRTESHHYFMKGNKQVPPHFFKAEAEGLQLIRDTDTVNVPTVYYFDEPEKGEEAILAMDWVEPGVQDASGELGQKLALMHQHTEDSYGYDSPTFVGTLDQPNGWTSTWVDYYRNYRLKTQMDYAKSLGRLPGKRQKRLEKLLERLDDWVPAHPIASLLHGDLWGGNWMTGADHSPYLIDPSVLYGDHGFELAFTELFGGFSKAFYDSYQEHFPLPDHYEDIKPLYQLFYLLVHLNMFGESYGSGVDRILKRYVG